MRPYCCFGVSTRYKFNTRFFSSHNKLSKGNMWMQQEEIREKLDKFKKELIEVENAYRDYDSPNYAKQLIDSIYHRLKTFAQNQKLRQVPVFRHNMPPPRGTSFRAQLQDEKQIQIEHFWNTIGSKLDGYLSSIIREIDNGEFEVNSVSTQISNIPKDSKKVFVVHGHDEGMKLKVLRFLDKLGLEGIVLHEQASESKTIIEKIEQYSSDVGYGLVIYSGDDVGSVRNGDLQPRARQNVVFEHGYLIGKLGRSRVTPIVEEGLEIPNDLSGVVYVANSNWEFQIAKELSAAGYTLDLNKLI